jgi:hypothetical protein
MRETARRDSSGIEIVEVKPESFATLPIWQLTPEPVLSIGQVDGEPAYLFSQILDAVRFDDGRIAIADGYGESGTGEIRFFDAQGVYLGQTGRSGRGPGEFQVPLMVERLAGDSIGVWDRMLQRVSVLTPTGGIVRDWLAGVCPDVRREDGSTPCYNPIGILDDGTLIMASSTSIYADGVDVGAKLGRPVVVAGILNGKWSPIDTLLQGDQYWSQLEVRGTSRVRPYSRMYGGRPYWTANGLYAAYARSDSSDIRLVMNGKLVRLIRWATHTKPVGPNEIAAYKDYDWGEERATAKAWMDNFEPAVSMPFFADLRLDDAGRLWVQDYYPARLTPNTQPRWWTVLSIDGTPLARVQLPGPASMTVLQIDTSRILARTTDSLEIQRIVLYGVEERARR